MALYHKGDVKNVLQFFSLISDGLGSVEFDKKNSLEQKKTPGRLPPLKQTIEAKVEYFPSNFSVCIGMHITGFSYNVAPCKHFFNNPKDIKSEVLAL